MEKNIVISKLKIGDLFAVTRQAKFHYSVLKLYDGCIYANKVGYNEVFRWPLKTRVFVTEELFLKRGGGFKVKSYFGTIEDFKKLK